MSDSKVLFSVGEDTKLVEIVSLCPIIYDPFSSSYKNLTAKDNAWKEVAKYVNRTVDDCKKRWRNIKDTYYKKQKKVKRSGNAGSSRKKWALAEMLTFLKKVDDKRSISKYEESDDAVQQNKPETETQSTTRSASKRMASQSTPDIPLRLSTKRERSNDKIIDLLKAQRFNGQHIIHQFAEEKNDDSIDLFFRSISSSVKMLRPDLINEAKMQSLKMIIDLENRNASASFNYAEEHSATSSCCSSIATSPAPLPS